VTPSLRPLLPFRALLLDADGCLFPSEAPAYDASADVTDDLMESLGVARRYTAVELRRDHTGRNFRATAPLLAAENDVALPADVLEHWVAAEKEAVTAHLARVLRPDPEVGEPLRRLADAFEVAVVSSSAAKRVAACLEATGLAPLVPDGRLFSAEDSLPRPISKPDPAIYSWAGARLGVTGTEALAVEDSEVGVRAAVAAGFPVVGLVHFAPAGEAEHLADLLRAAGATAIASSWDEIAQDLLEDPDTVDGGRSALATGRT
jgi:beta-phosphoglucomutase-like phosphatase (HAD superfamily)